MNEHKQKHKTQNTITKLEKKLCWLLTHNPNSYLNRAMAQVDNPQSEFDFTTYGHWRWDIVNTDRRPYIVVSFRMLNIVEE